MAEKKQAKLLTEEQRAICQDITAKKIKVESQRAQALLAVDDGMTQVKAAEEADLSAGQVRYLITNFKKKGLDLFPEELLKKNAPPRAKKETAESKPAPPEEEVATPEEPTSNGRRTPTKRNKKKKKVKRKMTKLGRKTAKSKKVRKAKKKKKRSKRK